MKPVVAAVRQIVGAEVGPANWRAEWWLHTRAVFSYSDARDFRALWGLDDGGACVRDRLSGRVGQNGDDLTVVIVWDGMPDGGSADPIAVEEFVSPYDWAMVLSWAVYEDRRLKDLKLRILILDARGPDTNDGGFSCQSLFYLQNAFPWIQDYRLAGSDGSGVLLGAGAGSEDPETYAWTRQAIPPGQRDAKVFVDDLLCPRRILTTHAEEDLDRTGSMRATRDLWIQNLLRAKNRHSVADLVAPAILASELGGTDLVAPTPARAALASALRSVDLLPGVSAAWGGTHLDGFDKENYFGRRRNVRVLLVDDQFRLGYHHVLGRALFGNAYSPNQAPNDSAGWEYQPSQEHLGTLTCHEDLEWLLHKVGEEDMTGGWWAPRCFLKDECDVLLLDLRLWQNEKARQELMCRLVDVANKLRRGDLPNADAKRAKEAAKKTPESLEALTFLPLLLSCIDPTLPIVLFSSTHQRVVSELLKPYPNIITMFAKPLPDGSWSSMHAVETLRSALDRALDIHEARIAWSRLCALSNRFVAEDSFYRFNENHEVPVAVLATNVVQLKTQLAVPVRKLVLAENAYDGLAAPWEILEGMIRSGQQNHGYYEIHIRQGPREQLATALRRIRNARNHGQLNPDGFASHKGRSVGVLQFLILLDFLEGRPRQCEPTWGRPVFGHARIQSLQDVRSYLGKELRPQIETTFLTKGTENATRRFCRRI